MVHPKNKKVSNVRKRLNALMLISTRWRETCVTIATTQWARPKKLPDASIMTDLITQSDFANLATSNNITLIARICSESADIEGSIKKGLRCIVFTKILKSLMSPLKKDRKWLET